MKLNIAFLQLLPGGSLTENMNKGITACRKAKEKGADIALFPEMWSTGYSFPHDEEALRQAAISADGAFVRNYAKLAAELDMAIAVTAGIHNRRMPPFRYGQEAVRRTGGSSGLFCMTAIAPRLTAPSKTKLIIIFFISSFQSF